MLSRTKRTLVARTLLPFSLLYCAVLVSAQETEVGDDIRVTAMESVSDTVLAITFEETGDGFAEFKFETSIDLSSSASAWTEIGSVTLEPAGEHLYRATIPVAQGENRFFRITGQGSSNDLDGDGVSNLEEEINGTDPNDPDSDDDGYSDGIEIAENTDPNNAEDSPDYSSLPAVRFTMISEVIEEDNFIHSVLLESDEPVFGNVGYTISLLSNATTEGEDNDITVVSNTVNFNGQTTAEIQLSIRDDAEIEDLESLIIDLEEAQDGSYRIGAVDQHIVVIKDNDAFWTAQIMEEGSESSFRMLIIEDGNQTTGKIISTAENGSGVIPEGEWNLTITKSDNTFEAFSELIPMSDSLLFDSVIERKLSIQVVPPVDTESPDAQYAYYLRSDRMVGTLLDEISGQDENVSFLNQESLKLLVMVRDVPAFVDLELPNNPAP